MNVDDILKGPAVGGKKRRMPDNPTSETLKKMKVTTSASLSASSAQSNGPDRIHSNGRGKFAPSVEDETTEDSDASMTVDFAPGNDADYFAEEDEEGRFYGGGLTGEQKEILNIFDDGAQENAQEDVEDMTAAGVKKILLRFQRALAKNQDQRSKFPDNPQKFIDSEMDLDSGIKALLPLAQYPKLSYSALVSSGTASSLVGLLSHDNADIMIGVVEVLHELTDEDVGNEEVANEDEEEEGKKEAALKVLIDCFLQNAVLELLVDNLRRLNEVEETDRQGVFHVLGIFENLIAYNTSLASQLVSQTSIIKWLLERMEAKAHDENRSYAAELLSIILQDNRETRLALGKADGVDTLLKTLSQFRKRDPVDADEEEFMDNIFDALSSALGEPENRKLFLDGEGIELMLIMIERKDLTSRCLKVLDYSMTGSAGVSCCEQFVEAVGLKSLFSTFMGKSSRKLKTRTLTSTSEETGHILGIISSLLSNLSTDSTPRIRLLTKLVERNYEKPDKLLELREHALDRLKVAEKRIAVERKQMEDNAEEIDEIDRNRWYLLRLEGGLYTLNSIDYILAWICMEDDGICSHVQQMLRRKGTSMNNIVVRLKAMHDELGDNVPTSSGDSDENLPLGQREILMGLITYLDSL